MAGKPVGAPFNGQSPCLVDKLGAKAILALNGDGTQEAVMLDMGGKLNRLDEYIEVRFLFAPGIVDELIEELQRAKAELGDRG